MPRTKGSRNKKFTVVEDMQEKALDQDLIDLAQEEVEEKFSSVRSPADIEEQQRILDTYTVKSTREGRSSETARKNREKMDLPDYIRALPTGKEKEKTIRAAAQAALLLGQPASQVSVQYGIPQSTVAQWEDTLLTAGAIGRRDRLQDMLLVYIEQELKSLMAISIVTSEETWIRMQSADELAHFIAVKADRLMAMLAAFGRAEDTKRRYMSQLEVIQQNA